MAKRVVPLRKGSVAGKEEKVDVKAEPTLKEITSEVVGSQRKLGINPAKLPVNDKAMLVDTDQSNIIQLKEGTRRVGVSKGVTVNLQNYESARITYWMERVINDTDEDYKAEIVKMSELIEGIIEADIDEFKG